MVRVLGTFPVSGWVIEDKLPGKVLSSIGDCGKKHNFDLKEFTDKFKEYISQQEQAASSINQQSSFETYEPPSSFSTLSAAVSATLTVNYVRAPMQLSVAAVCR